MATKRDDRRNNFKFLSLDQIAQLRENMPLKGGKSGSSPRGGEALKSVDKEEKKWKNRG